MCSGKVYFDLYEEREKRGINDIYLLGSNSSTRSRPRP
jgi:2-oxoglutarate dehydrogenase complex dehydrogenase (E1) component-like enzyme